MEFGLHYQLPLAAGQDTRLRYQDTLDQITLADELGFDVAWLTEVHFTPEICIMPAPLLVAAAAAARTTRIRVGTAVTLLPLHNPLRLAEEAATLDVISGGRLELGIGRGFYRTHFAAYDVPYEERSERFAEGLEVLERAWADAPLDYAGRFHSYHNLNVVPKPFRGSRPRVRMSAESNESFEFAAGHDLPLLTAPISVRRNVLSKLVAKYRQLREERDGNLPETDVAITVAVYVEKDGEQARAEAEPSVTRHKDVVGQTTLAEWQTADVSEAERARVVETTIKNFTEMSYATALDEFCAIGNPDEVSTKLREFAAEFGAGLINCWFNMGGVIPHEKVTASMRLFMEEVRPRFP